MERTKARRPVYSPEDDASNRRIEGRWWTLPMAVRDQIERSGLEFQFVAGSGRVGEQRLQAAIQQAEVAA